MVNILSTETYSDLFETAFSQELGGECLTMGREGGRKVCSINEKRKKL